MSNRASNHPNAQRIQEIAQDAMRAAVLAPTEREGFDMLGEALRLVSELVGVPSEISYA